MTSLFNDETTRVSKAQAQLEPHKLKGPTTLAVHVESTGVEASALDVDGEMLVEAVRAPTPHPCPPSTFVTKLVELTSGFPSFDRVSVGFPGMVRAGRVLSAPNLSTEGGPGTKVSNELAEQWTGFDLAGELSKWLGKPARVVNDADLQGMDVVSGKGLELVVTLGTAVSTAMFRDGELTPHLEIARQPFRRGQTYDEQIGEFARRRIGNKRWSRRVAKAVQNLDSLTCFDRVYIGGGNAKRLTIDLGPRASLVDSKAGPLGGLKLWKQRVT